MQHHMGLITRQRVGELAEHRRRKAIFLPGNAPQRLVGHLYADVKLLRLARETGGRVVTNDFNLNKVASVSGMKVLNLNDLAAALKPAVLAGEEMETTISKEGKEPGQGVGYMEDGTMIVVEGGRRHVGETVHVVVTTVIQTSAGRMIFSRLKEEREG